MVCSSKFSKPVTCTIFGKYSATNLKNHKSLESCRRLGIIFYHIVERDRRRKMFYFLGKPREMINNLRVDCKEDLWLIYAWRCAFHCKSVLIQPKTSFDRRTKGGPFKVHCWWHAFFGSRETHRKFPRQNQFSARRQWYACAPLLCCIFAS